MAIYIISEPEYSKSPWHNQILSGILENKSKTTEIKFIEQIDFTNITITASDVLIVIGTDFEWLDVNINNGRYFFGSKIIVLSNCDYKFKNDDFSIICFDISSEIKSILEYLKICNKGNIALYGINPKSSSDLLRTESFIRYGGKQEDMYYNSSSLSDCFEKFSQSAKNYDGVICVNDYAAISLTQNLKDESVYIVSCGDTILASKTKPSITNIDSCFKEFGKTAYQLYNLLQKNKNASSVTIKLKSNIIPRETTDFTPCELTSSSYRNSIQKTDDVYYKDKEINEMMRIETLLNICDKTDNLILKELRSNTPTDRIADKLFMSVGGIKYRLKNMYKICDVQSKNEFIELINKYINE